MLSSGGEGVHEIEEVSLRVTVVLSRDVKVPAGNDKWFLLHV